VWPPDLADTLCPRLPLTLTFDRLTLKLMRESHLRCGTFLPSLVTQGLWVLELFAAYATDGQTNGWTKAMLSARFPAVGGIIVCNNKSEMCELISYTDSCVRLFLPV